jgi:hypothetical protein
VQILLAFLIGGALGMAVHFVARGAGTRGVALGPVIGALTSGLVWMILTWAGFALDNPWLWVSAFVAPLVVTYPALVLLARARSAHDARERVRLRIG